MMEFGRNGRNNYEGNYSDVHIGQNGFDAILQHRDQYRIHEIVVIWNVENKVWFFYSEFRISRRIRA